ncbi:MAG: choice-of-anchor J domain-containing protein, partial [Candidatus Neomarinimicrobiota bacterium]|nr:choice-of-anchor J domain-containing protein [Candidatus Neomarinimicrobiota bacterium]
MASLRKYFCVCKIFLLPISIAFSNITVSIGDVAVTGYTEDIVVPVTVANPDNTVGGFQFDVLAVPTLVTLSGAIPVDADNFSADYNVFDDGSGRIVFYSNTGDGIAAGGDNVVMNLHYNGSEVLSALVDLEAYDLTVSDEDGTVISGDLVNGSITIGNVVVLSATSDTGDVLEEVYLDINLQNPSLVGGVQFDLYDTPNYLDVTGFSTTERSEGFTIDFNEMENGLTRVLIYSADNENIESGTGPIVNMEMMIHDNAYNSNVGVNFENVTVTDDIGGTYWVAGADSGTVTVSPGYIEEPHNLQAQDGMDAQVLLNWEPPYGPIPEDFVEDFEEGVVPDDWNLTTNSAQGWFITQDASSAFWTVPSHTWYMCSNDDMANDDGSMDYMIAPPLNVSGAQTITLNFASYYDGAYSQTAHIEVSTDGTNFTEVAVLGPTAEWVTETVDLSDHAGVPNLYIAFHSNDNGVWGSGWAVDDVFVTF